MSALFELLAQLLTAFATAAIAQIAASDAAAGRAGQEPPSVQRTVLQNGAGALPRSASTADCPEQSHLQAA